MPPTRKKAAENYGWTTGGMKGISHKSFVAAGGYGEVHEVMRRSRTLIQMMDANGEV